MKLIKMLVNARMFLALIVAVVFFASGGAKAADYSASTGTLSFCEQVEAQTKINQTRLSELTTTINSFVSYLLYDRATNATAWEFAWALQLYGVTADNLELLAYAKWAYCYSPVLPSKLLK